MHKVISIIAIYIILLLSATDLSADQKNKDGRNYRQNGSGYENWKGYGKGYGNWKGYGNGYGNWKGYGNGYGNGKGFWQGKKTEYGYGKWKSFWTGNANPPTPPGNNAPEPISSALFILGGAGLGLYKRFKNKD